MVLGGRTVVSALVGGIYVPPLVPVVRDIPDIGILPTVPVVVVVVLTLFGI